MAASTEAFRLAPRIALVSITRVIMRRLAVRAPEFTATSARSAAGRVAGEGLLNTGGSKLRIFCGTPFSKTLKSNSVSPGTTLPLPSVTITSTTTVADWVLNLTVSGGGGACCAHSSGTRAAIQKPFDPCIFPRILTQRSKQNGQRGGWPHCPDWSNFFAVGLEVEPQSHLHYTSARQRAAEL